MTQEFLISLFGWMAVLNIAILTLSTLLIMLMKDWAAQLHSAMFGLEIAAVHQEMYNWLAHYKLGTLLFSVVPYFALRLI